MTFPLPATRFYLAVVLLMGLRAFTVAATPAPPRIEQSAGPQGVKPSAVSMRLSVKDLPRSREFYERLGFRVERGAESQGWLILRKGETTIALLLGDFEGNPAIDGRVDVAGPPAS